MPTDELKLAREVNRQAQAESLMRNELLTESLMALENAYIAEWRTSQFRDTDARERLWQAVQIVGKVRDHLGKVVANGRLAQREIEELAKHKKRMFG